MQAHFRFCSRLSSSVKSVPGTVCVLQFAFPWCLLLIESQFTRLLWKLFASHLCIPSTFLSFYVSLYKTWSLTKESTLPSLLFSWFYCLADLEFRKLHRFGWSGWVYADFSYWKFALAYFNCRPLIVKQLSVINGSFDRSGIRTHVSEETATWTQRLRPLGHPASVVIFIRASVLVRDLQLASLMSQKFVGFCNLLVHGQPWLDEK